MSIHLSRNIVHEGYKRWFRFTSNDVQYFEIGEKMGGSLWLEGRQVGPHSSAEFNFNGRLFVPGNPQVGTIFDNFPVGPPPNGWIRRQHVSRDGYELVSKATGTVIFGFIIDGDVCNITTNLVDEKGAVWVETTDDGLKINRGPIQLGRGGISIGSPTPHFEFDRTSLLDRVRAIRSVLVIDQSMHDDEIALSIAQIEKHSEPRDRAIAAFASPLGQTLWGSQLVIPLVQLQMLLSLLAKPPS